MPQSFARLVSLYQISESNHQFLQEEREWDSYPKVIGIIVGINIKTMKIVTLRLLTNTIKHKGNNAQK